MRKSIDISDVTVFTFSFDKETKNTVRYRETGYTTKHGVPKAENGTLAYVPVIGTIYFNKQYLDTPYPENMQVIVNSKPK